MITREVGQSQASAETLEALMAAGRESAYARSKVVGLQRELKAARQAAKLAETIEDEANAIYYATEYSE